MTNALGLTEEEHRGHRVWSDADACLTLIGSRGDPTGTGQSVIDGCSAVLGYLVGLRDSPSPIVTTPYLDQLASEVDQLQTATDNWLTSPTPATTSNVQNAIETLAISIRAYPVTRDSFSYGVRSAFEHAMTRAEERIAQLEERVTAQHDALADISEAGKNARIATESVLRDAEDDIQKLKVSAEAQLARVDTAITNQQEVFNTAQGTRQESFSSTVATLKEEQADLKSKIEEEARSARTDLNERGESLLAGLEELKVHAEMLVGAIGIVGTATNYGLYAKQERRTANAWRYGAVAMFAAAFALFLAVIWLEHIDGGTPWQAIALKFGGSLALLAGGTYAARESAQHRLEERASKDTELLLKALEPFLATLTGDEDKETLRKDVAKRVFIEGRRTGILEADVERKDSKGSSNPQK